MDGVLIIDKPPRLTSHDVVARVRRIVGDRRVGHTGTLDPFATGVLVVLVGRATRLAQFLGGAEKEYEAVIRLGLATDTGDLTGTPISTGEQGPTHKPNAAWTDGDIQAALESLRGEIEQVPPMFSAKKQGGRKLYELARRGQEVEREAARVIIQIFDAISDDEQLLKDNLDGTTDVKVRVVCSAGTYVRTLAEDFGKRLGVGAHLAKLRRTRAGEFDLASALSLDKLQQIVEEGLLSTMMLEPDAALGRLPFVSLSSTDVRRTKQGIPLKLDGEPTGVSCEGEPIRMRDETGRLIAVGAYDRAAQLLHPRVVLTVE